LWPHICSWCLSQSEPPTTGHNCAQDPLTPAGLYAKPRKATATATPAKPGAAYDDADLGDLHQQHRFLV
jgi:hypothetical protein